MDTKEEIRALFEENLEFGKWANCQALITEIANSDVLEAQKWSNELVDAQQAHSNVYYDEQLKHQEEPIQEN